MISRMPLYKSTISASVIAAISGPMVKCAPEMPASARSTIASFPSRVIRTCSIDARVGFFMRICDLPAGVNMAVKRYSAARC